jgi:hypothetical protein
VAIPRKESPLLFGFITMSSETDRRRTPTQVLLLQGRLEGLWGGLFNELGLSAIHVRAQYRVNRFSACHAAAIGNECDE